MILQPFSLLEPYADQITVALFTREDNAPSDQEAAVQLGYKESAGLHQVHGNKTVVVTGEVARDVQADGMLTTTTGLVLCTRWADCQNFVTYAPETGVLGVLHMGWKGLIAGALQEHFAVLAKEFGVQADQVLVASGPSLSQQCAEFTDPALELPNIDPQYFDGRCADLAGAAEGILWDLGVPRDHFERLGDCTASHPEKYFTYRGGDRELVVSGKSNMLCAAKV